MSSDAVSGRTRRLIFLASALGLSGALILVGVLFGQMLQHQITASTSAIIGGPFTLAATNGQSVTDQTYRGKWVLIYFGYTYCPDACPTALNNISVALERLGTEAAKLQPLFVTVDPQRDTRDEMGEYLKPFDSRIIGLTGTKDQIDNVIKEFHVYASAEKSERYGSNYYVSHSSYLYLMDPRGNFVNVIHGDATGDELATWLREKMAYATS
jgi:protein SCO1/2